MPDTALEDLRQHSARMDVIDFAFKAYPGSFEEFFMGLPLPGWVKDTSGRMVLTNRAYEAAYDISPYRYAGEPDAAVWGETTEEEFGVLDNQARDENRMVIGVEMITLPRLEKPTALWVAKWPTRWNNKGVPTHIAGVVLGSVVLRNEAA